MPKPRACPHCGAHDSLVSIGPGVERVEEEARSLFPEARVAVFSSDTVFDAREARRMIEAMAQGHIDILVATQAAAKGHNFPNLTLVGVRSEEHTSELQSLMRISYAVFCLKKKKTQ